MPRIVVHHLNNSRSQRVLWLLEEMGLEYTIKHYQRDTETMLAPDELKNIHPLGKSPVIEDRDLVIAETGAIIEYLIDSYGGGALIPAPGTPARLRYTYWLHFAEGTAMSPLLMKLVFDRIESRPAPFFIRPILKGISKQVKASFIEPRLIAHMDHMEAELARAGWFTGDKFTAADVMMSFPLELSVGRAGFDNSWPNALSFLNRIHSRPAYKRALEKGGQYDFVGAADSDAT
jgi:glutathione S-transferase